MSTASSDPPSESGESRTVSTIRKTRSLWLVALAIAIIVIVEGFALSWGNSSSTPSRGSAPSTVNAAAGPDICSKGATYRFIEIDYVRYGGGTEPATVTGHVVTLHCGGPDDFHFQVHSALETVSLGANARITLMTLAPAFYIGTLKELNDYLAHDEDGNVFRITGPNSRATALTAMFHP